MCSLKEHILTPSVKVSSIHARRVCLTDNTCRLFSSC